MASSFLKFIVVKKSTQEETVIECDSRGLPILNRARRRNQKEMSRVIKKCNERKTTRRKNTVFTIPKIKEVEEQGQEDVLSIEFEPKDLSLINDNDFSKDINYNMEFDTVYNSRDYINFSIDF